MNRNAKDLQRKARSHEVDFGDDASVVESGSSGDAHVVHWLVEGDLRCTCEWCKYHEALHCSHKLAVRAEAWALQGRRLSWWGSEEAARRQRQPYDEIEPGLFETRRLTWTRN